MSFRRLLAPLVVVLAVALAPSTAHASAAFRFFTDRAAFLAQFATPTTTQVTFDAEPTGPIVAAGGIIFSGSASGGVVTTGATVIDPAAAGLPASYGTDNLLSLFLERFAPGSAGGDVNFTLPSGVTGFAFEFGVEPLASDDDDGNASLEIFDGGPPPQLDLEEFPFGPAGTLSFLGIVIDPTAPIDPTTGITSVSVGGNLTDAATELRLLFDNVEYTTSPVVSAVPEPATLGLLAAGLGLMLVGARRRGAR